MSTVLITAGGTGGHVFPALAVARALREQGVNVVWLGTREGIEARLVPAAGFEIEYVKIRGLRGRGFLRWLLLPVQLNLAMWQALRILRRRRPDAVLAMGGYASGPGSIVASALRIPLLVHEQNAIAGFTNRWLSHIADVLMAGFPGAFGAHPHVRVVGNPVRAEILSMPSPESRLAAHSGRLRLLVVGGSQGARVFNETIPAALRALPELMRPDVWHQTGKSDESRVAEAYRDFMPGARVTAFIDDMAAAYNWADLVVCRSGAMTVAELAAAGVASILVPFPHATDDHQTANARFLSERDAAVLVPQPEFTVSHMADQLTSLAGNRQLLTRMAHAARGCAVTDATETVAGLCMEAAAHA
jgi:UDP-N-acetylglucosamine--N-acetylmuramyl-(pentapeptide) pyrophosphoryl-undecaprenol N-acetylglucosamine transferase